MKAADSILAEPNRWRERAVALAAVSVPILVLFGPVLFSDRLFAMRDAGHYYYPLFKWCADEWGAGRVPLWNPLENCGTAVHADPTASIWYPGKLLFALPLDFSVNFKLYIVGHVVLCAWTAYRLARKWGASRYAAALAALSYSCGGTVVFQHCNIVYLVGAAWLPVAAGLVDDLLREQRIASAVWLGVVLALMVLGGDPQMAYHVLLMAGLYAILWANRRRQSLEGIADSNWRRLTLLAVAALLAFLLSAVQILPSAAATAASDRARFDRPRNIYEAAGLLGRGPTDWQKIRDGLCGPPAYGTHHETAYEFSNSPWRFAEVVWPNIGGRMYPTHRRWFSLFPEESRIWSPSLYVGLLPLALGLSAISWRSSDLRIHWLSWSMVIFTLGSLGTFGIGWLARKVWLAWGGSGADFPLGDAFGGVYWLFVVLLPTYAYFRYPAKLLVVASLALAMLAAVGWDRTLARPPRRLLLVLLLLGIGSGIAAAAGLIASQLIVLGERQSSIAFGPFDSRGAWTDIVSSLVHTSLVSLTLAGLLRASAGREPPEASPAKSERWHLALLVVCAAELAFANHWLIPTAPASLWRQPSVITQAIRKDESSPRIYRSRPWFPPSFFRESSPNRLEEMVAWERQTLGGRYALLDGAPIVNAQTGLKRADLVALLDAVDDSTSREGERAALGRLGVRYVILSEESEPDFAEPVQCDGIPAGAALWELTNAALPEGEPLENHYEPLAFYRGAWISGLSWGALLVGVGIWRWRRRRIERTNQSTRC